MSSTQEWRKCYICGDEVLWQTNGIGWHPIQYHDCKPVPGARLEQVERERDEARKERAEASAAHASAAATNRRYNAKSLEVGRRLEQAVALLREAPDKSCDCEEGRACGACEYNTRKDAFLAGQPAPVKLVVDDAMVERSLRAFDIARITSSERNNHMRAALVVALEGRA